MTTTVFFVLHGLVVRLVKEHQVCALLVAALGNLVLQTLSTLIRSIHVTSLAPIKRIHVWTVVGELLGTGEPARVVAVFHCLLIRRWTGTLLPYNALDLLATGSCRLLVVNLESVAASARHI